MPRGAHVDSARARELGKKSGEARRRQAEQLHRENATIIEAMQLWPEFSAPSWDPWKAFLRALFGLPLSLSPN